MASLWPGTETRERVRFISDVLQAAAIIFTIVWAATTFRHQVTVETESPRRELSRPYAEKQLELYLDAARVVALLAAKPDSPDAPALEARFWELYWGELAFVESRFEETREASVEHLMVQFCERHFGKDPCHSVKPELQAALDLSHQASDEVRAVWENIGRPVEQ